MKLAKWIEDLQQQFSGDDFEWIVAHDELTVVLPKLKLREFAFFLRDDPHFQFSQLIDVCGVDYAEYGISEWVTEQATFTGFSRGVDRSVEEDSAAWQKPRFAVVYHLLSLNLNRRIRLRVFAEDDPPIVDSVIDIWPAANWFEREAFDLYGILFAGHPDLRRILTDYGFVGHPFRKDFPLSGEVEVRYDAASERVIYEAVDIEPRVLVPKVIRAAEHIEPVPKPHDAQE